MRSTSDRVCAASSRKWARGQFAGSVGNDAAQYLAIARMNVRGYPFPLFDDTGHIEVGKGARYELTKNVPRVFLTRLVGAETNEKPSTDPTRGHIEFSTDELGAFFGQILL